MELTFFITFILFLCLLVVCDIFVILYHRHRNNKLSVTTWIKHLLFYPAMILFLPVSFFYVASPTIVVVYDNEEYTVEHYLFDYTDSRGKTYDVSFGEIYCMNETGRYLQLYEFYEDSLKKLFKYKPKSFCRLPDLPGNLFTAPGFSMAMPGEERDKLYLDYDDVVIRKFGGMYLRIDKDDEMNNLFETIDGLKSVTPLDSVSIRDFESELNSSKNARNLSKQSGW